MDPDEQEKTAQSQARAYCQHQAKKAREQEIRELEARIAYLKRYEELHPCLFCRDLPEGNQRLKHHHTEDFGLIFDRENDEARCPECGRVMAQWE